MTTWIVEPRYKKSIEEHEHFVKDQATITRKTGWRWAQWTVTTTDDETPHFVFDYVPGGDGKRDSIDMYNCSGPNIDEVEFVESWDGCWENIEFPEDMDDNEQQSLQERIDEDGFYKVIEEQEGYMQNDTEMWVWGPITIKDENDNVVKIVIADEDGNMVDFVEK